MKLPAWLNNWLPAAIIATGVIAFAYAAVQQNYRQTANDPQIQFAQDGVEALQNGASPVQMVAGRQTEIATSLAPFVTIYNENREVLATGGLYRGQLLTPPAGSFEFAKAHGQNRFTWEPKPGLRLAAVLAYNGGAHPGYVLAARNLREVEERESQLVALAAMALAAVLGATLIATLVIRK